MIIISIPLLEPLKSLFYILYIMKTKKHILAEILSVNSLSKLLTLGLPLLFLGVTFTAYRQWPLSNVPMYANVKVENSFSEVFVYGITEQDEEILLETATYFKPFDSSWLSYVIGMNTSGVFDEGNSRDNEFKQKLISYYRRGKELGTHHGPTIKEVRVYDVKWNLKQDFSNLKEPEFKKRLL